MNVMCTCGARFWAESIDEAWLLLDAHCAERHPKLGVARPQGEHTEGMTRRGDRGLHETSSGRAW